METHTYNCSNMHRACQPQSRWSNGECCGRCWLFECYLCEMNSGGTLRRTPNTAYDARNRLSHVIHILEYEKPEWLSLSPLSSLSETTNSHFPLLSSSSPTTSTHPAPPPAAFSNNVATGNPARPGSILPAPNYPEQPNRPHQRRRGRLGMRFTTEIQTFVSTQPRLRGCQVRFYIVRR